VQPAGLFAGELGGAEMIYRHVVTLCALVAITSCATQPMDIYPEVNQLQANYEAELSAMRVPLNEVEVGQACTVLRVEIARQRGQMDKAYAAYPPMAAAEMSARIRRNIALLESKMAEFRCP